MTASHSTTLNPLTRRDPELMGRLAALRGQVNEMLLDELAADTLRDPAFRAAQRPHARADVGTVLQVLRVLTKPSWDAGDLRLLDACWREATLADLFAEAFEAERHRLRQVVEEARQQLTARESLSEKPLYRSPIRS